MKKIIMLTILAIYVILICVGCKSGKLFIDSDNLEENRQTIDNEKDDFVPSGEYEVSSGDETSSGEEEIENNNEVTENFVYNESGKIIIAMFHRFADKDLDEWTRSYDNFYNDLKYLYEHNYRTISLNDYINNDIKVPVGCTPIVFTFDDGSKGQFNLIKDENGELVANPKSAVGIMERFYEEHPDFGLNGTFFINSSSFFTGEGTNEEKLKYLIDKGFEIGNHTSTHVNFSKATPETIQKEVGTVANLVRKLADGYEISALALPYGISSKEYKSYIAKGEFEGQKYENKVILLVGANPALPSNNEKVNLLALPRVRATGGGKSIECDLYYWLDVMEKNPKMKYERIS